MHTDLLHHFLHSLFWDIDWGLFFFFTFVWDIHKLMFGVIGVSISFLVYDCNHAPLFMSFFAVSFFKPRWIITEGVESDWEGTKMVGWFGGRGLYP